MTWLMWIVLAAAEISFLIYGIISKETKGEWKKKRFLVNGVEGVAYLLMLLLPGIDFSFRWKGLAILLMVRLAAAGLFCLIRKKSGCRKKTALMIFSAAGSIVLFSMVMVPAFLFNDYKGRPVTGEHKVSLSDAILIDHGREESFEKDGSFREVPVHLYFPEDINNLEDHSLPLIVFSHGAFGYYESNASAYLELASNGYVVISLDHPYHAFFTKDSDNKTILVNGDFFKTAMKVGSSDSDITEAETYEITSKWMELRESDINFVLDNVINASKSGEFGQEWCIMEDKRDLISDILKHTDTEKIGLMGHSMGGAAAVSCGRRPDVSAVIDLDGTMLGEETGVQDGEILINEEPYTTPLLAFDSESHHDQRIMAEELGETYVNNVILDHSLNGYSTYVEGSAHMNFTDLPLFSPILAKMLGTGTVDTAECIDYVNETSLAFFDCFLKQNGEFKVSEKY